MNQAGRDLERAAWETRRAISRGSLLDRQDRIAASWRRIEKHQERAFELKGRQQ